MSKFNITRIAQDGFLHHAAMADLQDSLAWALSSLGHTANCTLNWFSEHNETNIILCPEFIADFQRLPPNSIIYNLEQPGHPLTPKVKSLVRQSNAIVWDYSFRSVQSWRDEGFTRVHHVPIGYTPNLTRIPHSDPLNIDVLFFGWMTERRRAILDSLTASGLTVVSSAACYGGGRDELISRSRVCLNLHHDGRDRFEIVRCSFLMANSKCVVTEPSSDDDEYDYLSSGLARVPARLLVDFVHSLVKSDSERIRMEAAASKAIRSRSFSESIAAALFAAALDAAAEPPAPSRTLTHAIESNHAKRSYLDEARRLTNSPHPAVAARFSRACREGDMAAFAPWLRAHAHGNVVEIGVRDGASTSAFLAGIEDTYGHLYSIDIQPCSHLFPGHPSWTFIQADSKDFQTVTRQLPFEIDLLLIDGDHSRAGVLSDIEYARNVRPGGYLVFHDTSPEPRPADCNDMGWPGDDVKSVYDNLCRNMAPLGWTHFDLPGKYGMGVLQRPQPDPAVTLAPRPEDCQAQKAKA
jgi:Methyltransferase domain